MNKTHETATRAWGGGHEMRRQGRHPDNGGTKEYHSDDCTKLGIVDAYEVVVTQLS